jgi:hypothetical protein
MFESGSSECCLHYFAPKTGNVYLQIYNLQGKMVHQKLLG